MLRGHVHQQAVAARDRGDLLEAAQLAAAAGIEVVLTTEVVGPVFAPRGGSAVCPFCGSPDVVEVDNPMRREVRHRRGVACPGYPAGT